MNIPSFGGDWGFVMAFNVPSGSTLEGEEQSTSMPEALDTWLEAHIAGGEQALRYYDKSSHVRMFHLAKPLNQAVEADKRIMTKDNPIFMY